MYNSAPRMLHFRSALNTHASRTMPTSEMPDFRALMLLMRDFFDGRFQRQAAMQYFMPRISAFLV